MPGVSNFSSEHIAERWAADARRSQATINSLRAALGAALPHLQGEVRAIADDVLRRTQPVRIPDNSEFRDGWIPDDSDFRND